MFPLRISRPIPSGTTVATALTWINKVVTTSGDDVALGGDPTTAEAIGIVYNVDEDNSLLVITRFGPHDNAVQDAVDIDYSADGQWLSFDANGEIVKGANGKFCVGMLMVPKDNSTESVGVFVCPTPNLLSRS